MSITICKAHQLIIQKSVDQLLSADQINCTVIKCGYSIQANFFPRDFEDLCKEVTQLAMQSLQNGLYTFTCQPPETSMEIEKFATCLIRSKLEEKCTIVNPLSVRNPPPNSLSLPDTWKRITSWLS